MFDEKIETIHMCVYTKHKGAYSSKEARKAQRFKEERHLKTKILYNVWLIKFYSVG